MADNLGYTPGVGATVATDEVGGFHYQRVKLVSGADGIVDDVTTASPLPVETEVPERTVLTTITVAASASSVEIIANHPARRGLIVSNLSTAELYLSFTAPATSTNAFIKLPADGVLFLDQQMIATNAIYGFWTAVDGTAQTTQFV